MIQDHQKFSWSEFAPASAWAWPGRIIPHISNIILDQALNINQRTSHLSYLKNMASPSKKRDTDSNLMEDDLDDDDSSDFFNESLESDDGESGTQETEVICS